MKIIATAKDEVVCTLTHNEIARLLGFYSKYNSDVQKAIEAGTEIDLNGLYQRLHDISYLNKQIKDARDTIKSAAETLDGLTGISGQFDGLAHKLES